MKSSTAAKPKVSVVVCTYNRLGLLKQCLNSILVNDFADYELIVVDDNSTDGTAEYLRKLSLIDNKVTPVIHKKNLNIAASRNAGIKKSKSDIVLFTDDDCIVSKTWIKEMLASFANSRADFVIGNVIYNKHRYRGRFPERIITNSSATFPMGCNIAYKKSIFKKIGGFDTKNFSDYHEDREMALRAIAAGYSFISNPKAVVYHQKTLWSSSSLLKSSKAVAAWPKLKSIHPDHYLYFPAKFVKFGFLIHPEDYLIIIFYPIMRIFRTLEQKA